jgi:hypothetical protein
MMVMMVVVVGVAPVAGIVGVVSIAGIVGVAVAGNVWVIFFPDSFESNSIICGYVRD